MINIFGLGKSTRAVKFRDKKYHSMRVFQVAFEKKFCCCIELLCSYNFRGGPSIFLRGEWRGDGFKKKDSKKKSNLVFWALTNHYRDHILTKMFDLKK